MKKNIVCLLACLPVCVFAAKDTGLFEELGQKLDKASEQIAVELDETTITAKIMGKYSIDHDLGPFKIQTFTKGNNVTLVGELQTEQQYEKAIMYAAATEGAHHVDATRLNVIQKQNPLSDIYLTALIKAKLIKSRLFEKEDPTTWPIKIEAKSNIISISGALNGAGQKQHVLEIIHSIEGISSIKDDIKIDN